jgi:hypothetical protein
VRAARLSPHASHRLHAHVTSFFRTSTCRLSVHHRSPRAAVSAFGPYPAHNPHVSLSAQTCRRTSAHTPNRQGMMYTYTSAGITHTWTHTCTRTHARHTLLDRRGGMETGRDVRSAQQGTDSPAHDVRLRRRVHTFPCVVLPKRERQG